MTREERFLAAAHEEGKHSISVAGSTLVASAVGVGSRVSARAVVAIIRGTTKIDAATKAALGRAVEEVEGDAALGARDKQDAVDAIDRLREELGEGAVEPKRVRRLFDTLAGISRPAADAVRACPAVASHLGA